MGERKAQRENVSIVQRMVRIYFLICKGKNKDRQADIETDREIYRQDRQSSVPGAAVCPKIRSKNMHTQTQILEDQHDETIVWMDRGESEKSSCVSTNKERNDAVPSRQEWTK